MSNLTSSKVRAFQRVLKGVLYVIYLIIVLECGARLVFWPRRIVQFVSGLDDSTRRILWVKQHGKGWQKLDYRFEIYHPVRGWAMASNVRNMQEGDGTLMSTNSLGIRGTTEYSEFPASAKKRIIVLGDSFTFGNEVTDDQTYSHYLGAALSSSEVLNLGVPGYGHDQMLLYLEEEGVKYHPGVVLVGFNWYDMHRNCQGFLFYWKPRFVLREGRLLLTHVPVPPPEDVVRQEIYRSKLLDLGNILWHRFSLTFGSEQEDAREITSAIFDEMLALCHRIGATLVFAYLPVGEELADPSGAMSPNEQFLSQYCESRHVPCVFLRPDFLAARKKGLELYNASHWRPYEHLIAASALKKFLICRGLATEVAGDNNVPPSHCNSLAEDSPSKINPAIQN